MIGVSIITTTQRQMYRFGLFARVNTYTISHEYGWLNPLSEVPAMKAAMRQAGSKLKVHLQ